MRKNYSQVRKQRELAKKARQQEKQERRSARLGATGPAPATETPEAEPVTGSDGTVRGAS